MRFFHRHKKRLRKKDHCMYRKFGKRILGIILSGCGIVILSPIYLLVALAIVLDDPGPVFFRQKRVGINLTTGLVMIDNALLYTKSKGTYSGPTKTGRVRALMLAPQCMDLLKKWQEEQNRLKELYGDKWTENGYVFTRDDGNLMNPDSITDWLNNFSEKHHLPHIHPHAFRHPYVKHTTKKYNSEKQKTQATKIDLIAWVFRFCIFNYSKRSWTL